MPAMKWWGWGHDGVEFTHQDKPALAPFIAAFRGAFRVTYGLGFLYDINYAYNTNTGQVL